MAKDVLYGVYRVFLQEIDPETELPLEGGVQLQIDCAESITVDPQTDDGTSEILRCKSTNRILAYRTTPDVVYAYEITLTDNQFDAEILALLSDSVIVYDTDGTTVIGVDAGAFAGTEEAATKYFRLTIFVEMLNGASTTGYAKFVFNKCYGIAPSFTFEQAFYAPEFTIMATEASNAGLPVYQMRYVAVGDVPSDVADLEPIDDGNDDTP